MLSRRGWLGCRIFPSTVAESLAPRRMDRPFFPPRCSMKETDDRRRKFRSSKFSVQVQFQVLIIDSKA